MDERRESWDGDGEVAAERSWGVGLNLSRLGEDFVKRIYPRDFTTYLGVSVPYVGTN